MHDRHPKITWPYILFSFTYAFVFAHVPWDAFKATGDFRDVYNYVYKIDILRDFGIEYYNVEPGLISALKSEYLFLKFLSLLSYLPFEAHVILRYISIFSIFSFHLFIARRAGMIIASIALINPIMIDLFMSQLRSAFAFSLFYITASKYRLIFERAILSIALFIHTSIAGFWVAMEIADKGMAFGSESRVRRTLFIFGSIVSVIIIFNSISPLILAAAGDRRVLSEFANKSFSYSFLWLTFFTFLTILLSFKRHLSLVSIITCICGISFSALEIIGFPAFRFVALLFPVFMASTSDLSRNEKFAVISALCALLLPLFHYWA